MESYDKKSCMRIQFIFGIMCTDKNNDKNKTKLLRLWIGNFQNLRNDTETQRKNRTKVFNLTKTSKN